jgi:hypothetical protein
MWAGGAMNNEAIVKALGRKPLSSIDKWLRTYSASPGETHTLTTTEAYRLYCIWCETMEETPRRSEVFAHEMKLLKYQKKVKYIRNVKRVVYMLNEPAALKLLASHRADPTPRGYRMAFDVGYYRTMGLHFTGMQPDSPLSPYPKEWFDGAS